MPEPTIRVEVRVPVELGTRFEQQCQAEHRTRTDVIIELIAAYIAQQHKEQES